MDRLKLLLSDAETLYERLEVYFNLPPAHQTVVLEHGIRRLRSIIKEFEALRPSDETIAAEIARWESENVPDDTGHEWKDEQ